VKEAMVTRPLSGIIVSLVSIFAGALTTDLDHGQHSAFFKFANNYWCRAGDPWLSADSNTALVGGLTTTGDATAA
jgi:hypothetical protein